MSSKAKHRERSRVSHHRNKENLALFNRMRWFKENPDEMTTMLNALNRAMKNGDAKVIYDDEPNKQEQHRTQARGN